MHWKTEIEFEEGLIEESYGYLHFYNPALKQFLVNQMCNNLWGEIA